MNVDVIVAAYVIPTVAVDLLVHGNATVDVISPRDPDPRRIRDRATHARPTRYARTMLSFQRLDVYQCSIEFLALAHHIITRLPKGNAERNRSAPRGQERGRLGIG